MFMKKILAACFIVFTFSCNTFADLAYISTEESVKRSDFIVIGTLQSISDIYQDDANFGRINVGDGEGVLVIDKVVAGNVLTNNGLPLKSGYGLRLKWSEFSACLSGWHRRTENKKGVWLLKFDKDGAIETSHPAQFASIEQLSEIKKYVKKYSKQFRKATIIQPEVNRNSSDFQQNAEIPYATVSEISTLSKAAKYYPSQAFLVILVSISLYWLLYRSRFKIR
jgi:hypothetical protein